VKGKSKQQKQPRLPFILSLSLVALLVGCYFFVPAFHDFIREAIDVLTSDDEARVKEWVSRFGMWGPVVIIFTMVIQMFMFIVPNILLIIISILSYGPIWGSLIAWIGIFLASSLGYFIGSKLSPITVKRFVSGKVQRVLSEFIRDYGMKAIVVIRLSTFSNDGLSIVAGLLKMEYKRFILATLMGITPLIAIIAFFRKKGQIEKGLLWAGIVLIACLVLYVIIDKRRKKQAASK
jgi:uncharacterized membrane protein YdjX (TVP38/TMEM64 family)